MGSEVPGDKGKENSMDIYTAQEEAYKRGYEAGRKNAVENDAYKAGYGVGYRHGIEAAFQVVSIVHGEMKSECKRRLSKLLEEKK